MQSLYPIYFIGFISALLLFIAFIVITRLFIRERFSFALYLMAMTFFPLLWVVLSMFGKASNSSDLEILAIVIMVPMGFFFVMLFDSLTRETVDPIKMSYVSIMAGIFFLSSILQLSHSSFDLFTQYGRDIIFFVRYISWNLYSAPLGILWIYYTLKIYQITPSKQKNYAAISFLGAVLVGIINPILVITQIGYTIGLHMLAFSTGVFLSAIAWAKEPKLAYVLPFKALRLAVVETKGGLPLFTHIWNDEGIFKDTSMFTSIIQAVTIFIDETMERGSINEIHLEEAMIIVMQDANYDIASILVTSKVSQILRRSLEKFTREFLKVYDNYLEHSYDLEKFKSAKRLVKKHFRFIPEYSI
ncbi:MAG: hypothetical protein GF411_03465 [Candidatus Lokiarchaeota archaeon]|nr:hypothetical protein [Candidatus Lokiarchaeota archaeon]